MSKGRIAQVWDPQIGTVTPMKSTRTGKNLVVKMELQPYETRVIVVR
jgi:hypothetical protein